MRRYGRVLKLKDGAEAEYDRLHAEVWPEVRAVIQRSGIRNYSIFRYWTWLFSCFELPEDVTLKQIGRVFEASPECSRSYRPGRGAIGFSPCFCLWPRNGSIGRRELRSGQMPRGSG